MVKQAKMKDSKTYIQYCRYYHGEETCPESIKQLPAGEGIWFYEMKWVEFKLNGKDFQLWLDEYNAYGMSDFSTHDGVPVSLKAILFNRYYKDGFMERGGEHFRQWYLETYLQIDLK